MKSLKSIKWYYTSISQVNDVCSLQPSLAEWIRFKINKLISKSVIDNRQKLGMIYLRVKHVEA